MKTGYPLMIIDVLSFSYISNYFAIQIVTRFMPFSENG